MSLPNNILCGICMKTSEKLLKTTETNSADIKWCVQLTACVPEVDWTDEILICQECADVLQTLYAFRNQCIQSSYLRNNKNEQTPQQPENYDIKNESPKHECNFDTTKQPTVKKDNQEFKCFHCTASFTSKTLIRKHILVKHGISAAARHCTHCTKVYMRQSSLEKHLLKIHGVKDVKQKMQETDIEKVPDTHIEEDEQENENCKMGAVEVKYELIQQTDDGNDIQLEPTVNLSIPETTKHLLKPTTPKTRTKLKEIHNCQECGVIFTTKYLLKRHMRNVHASEKNYNCETCGQKFASQVYLQAHKRYHSGKRPYICSFCGKGYITASDLYHHEKIHANKRAYRCEKCPKAFNTSSDLHKHKICVHQDRNEWKYICEYCQRRFPLKTNLDMHTKIHTGERNFACHLCDKKCINRSVLLRHIDSHSNVRSFKCNLCNQDYKYQKTLEIHLAKAHGMGNVKIPIRSKIYFCHICSKSYTANNKLQKHIRSHTGERPFSCQMCEKRFIDKSSVKQHLKTAHNVLLAEGEVVEYKTETVM